MLAEDGEEIVAEIGDEIEWKGKPYDALVGDPDISVDMEEGGLIPTGEFVCKVLRSRFIGGEYPTEGDVVTFDEKRYFVSMAKNKPDSAWIRFEITTNP